MGWSMDWGQCFQLSPSFCMYIFCYLGRVYLDGEQRHIITPQVNFFCVSDAPQSLAGNNLINLPLPFTTGDRWGFPSRRSIVNELRNC